MSEKSTQNSLLIIAVLLALGMGIWIGYTIRGNFVLTPMMSRSNNPSMMSGMMNHATSITDDAAFLMEMIPHHQEAVDTSQYMLSRTQDEQERQFLQAIVDVQTQEINKMKQWHRDWYGSEYANDNRYQAMMPDLAAYPNDEDAMSAYLHGMMMHHMGAIQMAQQVLLVTDRPELTSFAEAIIRTQNDEITVMRNWLRASKNRTGGMMDHSMH